MGRALGVLAWIGALLTVTLLVPYDDKAEPVRTRSFSFAIFEEAPPDPALVWVPMPDEWGQATTKLILNQSFRTSYSLNPSAVTCCSSAMRVQPDPGVRISPGTRWINITLQLKDPNPPAVFVAFDLRAANEWVRSVALRDRFTTTVAVDEEMNDWAPDPDTRWTFAVRASAPVGLEGIIRVEIGRPAEPLPATYAFRERWGGAPVVAMFDQRAALRDANVLSPMSVPVYGSQPPENPRLRALPPLGVEELRVVLYYNSSSTPSELHYRPLLSWAGADRAGEGWEQERVPPQVAHRQSQHGSYEWRLPVEPRMWDSPFAKASRWNLFLNWHGEPSNAVTWMDGDFHFRIEAVRETVG